MLSKCVTIKVLTHKIAALSWVRAPPNSFRINFNDTYFILLCIYFVFTIMSDKCK